MTAVETEPSSDWSVLRREIEHFAAARKRPPTPIELRRFFSERGIGPEAVQEFLRQLQTPQDVHSSHPKTVVDTPEPEIVDLTLADRSPPGSADPGPLVEVGISPRLVEVVEDLVDDWHRQGGALRRDQVVSLAAKRMLTADQLAVVDGELHRLGIEFSTRTPDPEPNDRHRRRTSAAGDGDIVGAYLHQIGQFDLIDAAAEVRLGRAIQTGLRAADALTDTTNRSDQATEWLQNMVAEGRDAHARFVEANLRLVVSVARQPRYAASRLEFIDRIQDGNLGLMHAADLFDPERGFKFSTYATWWIKQKIERSIADTGRTIRIPVHLQEKFAKIGKIRRRLADRLDREPTLAELADATGYTAVELQATADYFAPLRSLDEPVADDAILLDLLAGVADVDGRGDPQQHVLTASRRHQLDAVLDRLPDRQRDILTRRYDLHGSGVETLDSIGTRWGVTRERVRQLEKKAFDTLQANPSVGRLYDYLLTDTTLDEPRPVGGWPPAPQPQTRRPQGDRADQEEQP